jgi:hypothetical protein
MSSARPRVVGPDRFEVPEDVLRAGGRPEGEKVMIGVGEGPAATDRREARIPDRRKDHAFES